MKKEKCLTQYLTVLECAGLRGSSTEAILKAINSKPARLKAVRKGRQWLIHKNDFKKFQKANSCPVS